MISIQLKGVNQFRKDLLGFSQRLPILTKNASREIMMKIHEKAMTNLNQDLKWGHSVGGDGIEQSMQLIETGQDSVQLVYTSPHAFIVEHGGIGEVVKPQGAFPIGASQGGGVVFSKRFRLQQGKHFLERAVNEVMNSEEATRIIEKHIMMGLRRF